MKVLVYSTHQFDKPYLVESAINTSIKLFFCYETLDEKTVHLSKGFDAIAIFSSDRANKEIINKLSEFGVNFIALRSVGYDNVDLDYAISLGVKVANVPEYSPYSVAEHSVALLLALNRKLISSQKLINDNNFLLDDLVGFDLYQKKVGIVGLGKIGYAFAKIMLGFGCKIYASDPKEIEEYKKKGIKYTSLDYIIKNCDVVSLFCPLNAQTKYLINKNNLSKFKKNAILINTSRGGVVNTEDLIYSLENNHLKAAGLDVYENEKGLFFNKHVKVIDPLFLKLKSLNNVLITGHQAFLTKEALTGIANTTLYNLIKWSKNEKSDNELI